jgi:hypothetical protein
MTSSIRHASILAQHVAAPTPRTATALLLKARMMLLYRSAWCTYSAARHCASASLRAVHTMPWACSTRRNGLHRRLQRLRRAGCRWRSQQAGCKGGSTAAINHCDGGPAVRSMLQQRLDHLNVACASCQVEGTPAALQGMAAIGSGAPDAGKVRCTLEAHLEAVVDVVGLCAQQQAHHCHRSIDNCPHQWGGAILDRARAEPSARSATCMVLRMCLPHAGWLHTGTGAGAGAAASHLVLEAGVGASLQQPLCHLHAPSCRCQVQRRASFLRVQLQISWAVASAAYW